MLAQACSIWEIYVRENSGQEDNLSKSHAFSWISHKSEHFDFPLFFPSVSSGHDRSWLAPSSYYYTTQLVLTCMWVSGCTLHNIQDQGSLGNLVRQIGSRKLFGFLASLGECQECNPLSFFTAPGSSVTVSISNPGSSVMLSLSNLVARLVSSHMLPWLNIFIDYLIKKWFWVTLLDWFTFGRGQMINDGSCLLGPPGFRVHVLQQTRHRLLGSDPRKEARLLHGTTWPQVSIFLKSMLRCPLFQSNHT